MSTTRYFCKSGDVLDAICWAHYGHRAGTVEAVLEANPGLADLGPELPAGKVIILPELASPRADQPVKLWD